MSNKLADRLACCKHRSVFRVQILDRVAPT